MTNANYDRFLKIFGKLCLTYDNAGASLTTLQQQMYRTWEQIGAAAQEFADQPTMATLGSYFTTWNSLIQQGPAPLQTLMLQTAIAELVSSDFTGAIITAPGIAALTNKGNAATILAALAAEMTSDGKTLTTVGATGLANFFNKVSANAGGGVTGIPTSGAPSYADGTYVLLTIV